MCNCFNIFPVKKLVKVEQDAYTAVENAHALVVCTEWDEFKVRCLPYHFYYMTSSFSENTTITYMYKVPLPSSKYFLMLFTGNCNIFGYRICTKTTNSVL